MDSRFMMPESPVSWGTKRGSKAAALAGPTVDGTVACTALCFVPTVRDIVELRDIAWL